MLLRRKKEKEETVADVDGYGKRDFKGRRHPDREKRSWRNERLSRPLKWRPIERAIKAILGELSLTAEYLRSHHAAL